MKTIILCMLIPVILAATTYDSTLLQIGAKIFPKIALMEQGTNERIESTLNFAIVTLPSNKETAQRLSEMVKRQYPDGINNHRLSLTIVSPKEALEMNNGHGFILLLNSENNMLIPIIEHAAKNKILTFSLDPSLLQKGVAVSLYVGKNVKPYINTSTLKQVPFNFEYGFLKLSQPY